MMNEIKDKRANLRLFHVTLQYRVKRVGCLEYKQYLSAEGFYDANKVIKDYIKSKKLDVISCKISEV